MQKHEQNLFIALCQGAQLSGHETDADLEELLEEITEIADDQIVLPAQKQLADWLKISVDHCGSREDASVELWNTIRQRGYTLVDVPLNIRKQAFGGSLDIQKRAGSSQKWARLERKARLFAFRLLMLLALLLAVWYVAKLFLDT